jgi:ECF transporter S component (folate family)
MKTLHNQKRFSISNLTLAGLFIAIAVVLKSYLAINLSFTRISLAWVSIMTIGILLGPVIGGISGAIADIIGFIIFPTGPYFLGFTVAYAFVGIIPGLLKKVVLQSKSIYFFLFNSAAVIVFFVASVWALFHKNELILENGTIQFNTNFFLKVDPKYIEISFIYYILIAVVLLLLILLPIFLEKVLKNNQFIFPFARLLFMVTITCIICSLIIDTWSVSKVYSVPILVLLPKRIFVNFISIPIYAYLVAVLLTTLNKYIVKNENK